MNLAIDGGFSGVNRYLENVRKGFEGNTEIVLHSILLLEKPSMLFSKIREQEGRVEAIIPLPVDTREIMKEDYWMTKYSDIILSMLESHFQGKENLIWNTHCINLSRLAIMMKQRLGGKILAHLHCIPWKFDMTTNIQRFNFRYRKYLNKQFKDFNDTPVECLTYQSADRIVCVTNSARDYLVNCMNIEASKIEVIYNGLADEISGKLKKPTKRKNLLYVGRVSKEKGIFELLNTLCELRHRGYHFPLIVAGPASPVIIKRIREEYSMLDLTFLGKVSFDELCALYRKCLIGVVPSLHEQCSYVAIEMAMFGMPMAVADVDGLSEMFTNNENALKVPLSFDDKMGLHIEPEIFADILLRLYLQKGLRKKLGEKARELVAQRFDLQLMVENNMKIYRQLVG